MNNKISNATFSKALMAGAAFGALTIGAAPALADEIIVTATKRPQTLREVPIAVSVISADLIEKSNVRDLLDIQTSVPSLRVTQLQNASQTNFTIRGFGNGANNPGIESSVGVFIDGVYRSRSAAAILDLPTLERVEVLRGPQSTLFGKNVSAGAISITTKSPEFEYGGSVEATYGNFDQINFKGSLTGPISETLAFRVSGSTNNRDGYYTNIVDGSDQNERDRWAVRAQLLWEPSDTVSFRLIGDYNKLEENCCGAIQVINGPATQVIGAPAPFGLGAPISPAGDPFARQVALDTDTFNKLTGKGISLQGDWDLGNVALTSITSYREQSDNTDTDVDFSGADLATNPQDRKYETFTQELRLASVGDNRLDWMIGGFYFDESVTFQRDVIFGTEIRGFADLLAAGLGTSVLALEGASQVAAALTTGPGAAFPTLGPLSPAAFGSSFGPGAGVFGDYTMDDTSFSVFGQFDYDITDRLTISGGIAYLDDSKEATGASNMTEALSAFDNAAGGTSFVAATILGGSIPGAFGGPMLFDPAVPVPFLTALGTWAFVDPVTFAPARDLALATAQGGIAAGLIANPLAGIDALQFFQPQVNFPNGADPLDNGKLDGNKVTYTARLAYDVTDNINTYFTYATGWKAGAFNLSSDSRAPDPITGFGRTAAPEEVTLFELGLKASFDGGFINIALFDQEIEGFQSNVFNGTGFDLANAGKQSSRGFEVDSSYAPWDPLTFTFGITYLDPQYDSFTMAGCTPFDVVNCGAGEAFRDLSGTRVPGVHEISLSTSAMWTHDFSDTWSGFARVEYQHESDVPLIENIPASITRSVNLMNVSVGLETEGGFEVIGWARNVTNDEYFLQGFPTVVQSGSVSAYTNAPRTYGVTVRKSF